MALFRSKSNLDRALSAIKGLKAVSWEAVETLAIMAIETDDPRESRRLVQAASKTAAKLTPGDWGAARALIWLAKAEASLTAE